MGKLAANELQKMLKCIKKDSRVIVPPMVGYDSGVHCLGDKYLVVSTDPCAGVPNEWFGWLLINYAASDVALSGAKPQFCTITLLGPRPTDPRCRRGPTTLRGRAEEWLSRPPDVGEPGTGNRRRLARRSGGSRARRWQRRRHADADCLAFR